MRAVGKSECCGCGNCEAACPLGIVKLVLDDEGFLMPEIEESKCINCKKCVAVCPVVSNAERLKTKLGKYAYYAQAIDSFLRSTVASGGVASLLGSNTIRNGGVVYGSVYINHFQDVAVERIDKIEDIEKLKGSKYIQSIKSNIFHAVKKDLLDGIKVMYVGLPCEVAALKYYLQSDYENLLTVDLVCHGPTSTYALRDYIKDKSRNQIENIESFSMRYKENGEWTPYYMCLKMNNRVIKEKFWGSDFGYVFGRFGRKSCYACRFKKENRYSDITLGDAWGLPDNTVENDNTGISAVLINTEKGLSAIKSLDDLFLVEAHADDIFRGNPNLLIAREHNAERGKISCFLKKHGLHKTVLLVKPFRKRLKDEIHNLKERFLK